MSNPIVKYPHSLPQLKKLSDPAAYYEESRSLKDQLRATDILRKEAQVFRENGDLQNAYILLRRCAILVRDYLPNHPDFLTKLKPEHQETLRENGRRLMAEVRKVEPDVEAGYEQYETDVATGKVQRPPGGRRSTREPASNSVTRSKTEGAAEPARKVEKTSTTYPRTPTSIGNVPPTSQPRTGEHSRSRTVSQSVREPTQSSRANDSSSRHHRTDESDRTARPGNRDSRDTHSRHKSTSVVPQPASQSKPVAPRANALPTPNQSPERNAAPTRPVQASYSMPATQPITLAPPVQPPARTTATPISAPVQRMGHTSAHLNFRDRMEDIIRSNPTAVDELERQVEIAYRETFNYFTHREHSPLIPDVDQEAHLKSIIERIVKVEKDWVESRHRRERRSIVENRIASAKEARLAELKDLFSNRRRAQARPPAPQAAVQSQPSSRAVEAKSRESSAPPPPARPAASQAAVQSQPSSRPAEVKSREPSAPPPPLRPMQRPAAVQRPAAHQEDVDETSQPPSRNSIVPASTVAPSEAPTASSRTQGREYRGRTMAIDDPSGHSSPTTYVPPTSSVNPLSPTTILSGSSVTQSQGATPASTASRSKEPRSDHPPMRPISELDQSRRSLLSTGSSHSRSVSLSNASSALQTPAFANVYDPQLHTPSSQVPYGSPLNPNQIHAPYHTPNAPAFIGEKQAESPAVTRSRSLASKPSRPMQLPGPYYDSVPEMGPVPVWGAIKGLRRTRSMPSLTISEPSSELAERLAEKVYFPAINFMNAEQRTQGYAPCQGSMFHPGELEGKEAKEVPVGLLFHPLGANKVPGAGTKAIQNVAVKYPSLMDANKVSASAPFVDPRTVEQYARMNVNVSSEVMRPHRPVAIPSDTFASFEAVAAINTEKKRETRAILCGYASSQDNGLVVTTLLLPPQVVTDQGSSIRNDMLIDLFLRSRNMIRLGQIVTHPTQSCFLTSSDLHVQMSMQRVMRESVTVVVSPRHDPKYAVFRLTETPGLPLISSCLETSPGHGHTDILPLYQDVEPEQCMITPDALEIIDLRDD